jgi:site-specific DNA-methyltransferase (adenine-specific)
MPSARRRYSPRRRPTKLALFMPRSGVETATLHAGYIARTDALAFATALHDEIADIVFLDPPFNLGKNYGVARWLERADADSYELYLTHLIRHMVRILRPGGALFLYHLPYWASRLSHELSRTLDFRHWIAIAMKNGFVAGENLYPAHYALLYYTKGRPSHFHRPKTEAQRCRGCGETVKDYGGYESIILRKGINLSDFWEDLSPVRHKSRKHRKGNQLPLSLTDRVVAIAGVKRGLLVDPFAGSGTSLVSAQAAGMAFVGNDLSRASLAVCIERLRSARDGSGLSRN